MQLRDEPHEHQRDLKLDLGDEIENLPLGWVTMRGLVIMGIVGEGRRDGEGGGALKG